MVVWKFKDLIGGIKIIFGCIHKFWNQILLLKKFGDQFEHSQHFEASNLKKRTNPEAIGSGRPNNDDLKLEGPKAYENGAKR